MGGYVFAVVGMFVNNFLAPIQVQLSPNVVISSVIPLATGDEVIKFWKVKVKGQGRWGTYMRSTERPSSLFLCLWTG